MRGLAIFVFASALYAQQAYPLESLRVTGAERVNSGRILAVAGLKIGQAVNKANFDAARERLMATGAFESVGYQYKPSTKKTGYDAVIEVTEILQMFPYRFEELPVPEAALREAIAKQELLFEDEIPLTQPVLERYNRIVSTAAGKIAEGHITYSAAGEGAIVFRPPGDAPHIYEVHFSGNELLTTEQLSAKFILVAFGAEYKESQVRALLDSSVRRLYEAKGRLRVVFQKITAEPTKAPEVTGVSVSVQIAEGAEYKLGSIKVNGVATKQLREIETLADFKKDETANFDEVDKALERIRKRYWGTGYLHAKTSADRSVNDKDHVVDLTVRVDPGPQFTYGKLDIQGLDILSEPAIRKAWGPREGKPFDPTSPDVFLKQIRDDALFDNLGETKSVTKLNEEAKTADVTLTFKGGAVAKEQRSRRVRP